MSELGSGGNELIKLPPLTKKGLRGKLVSLVTPSLEKMLCVSRINEMYAQVAKGDTMRFLEDTMEQLQVSVNISEEDLARIPRDGSVAIVANHPFGAVEGIILTQLLLKRRPDVRMMANFILALIPELKEYIIAVDPFGSDSSMAKNITPLKDSIRWLKNGGALGIFPAGEVSALNLKKRSIQDKDWSPTVGRIIRKTGAPVLPVYFSGSNGLLFHLLGLIHPRLRTAMLPREMVNKANRTFDVAVGNMIPASKIKSFETDEQLMDYLKLRTYVLRNRFTAEKQIAVGMSVVPDSLDSLVDPQPQEKLVAEVDNLPDAQRLIENDANLVFVAKKHEIPCMLQEIGRLREMTFREVGEGTGKEIDLDRFDDTYYHLVLWSKENNEIIGSYRLGPTDTILESEGREGLYTNTLFKLRKKFLTRVNPGLELGRSFIQRKYQKSYSPLLLLWKGIATFVARNKQYSVLFGPVSISNDYQSFSRELMMRFLSLREKRKGLRRPVKPKTPPKLRPLSLAGLDVRSVRSVCRDIDDLASLISEVEDDQKGVPVLLRQYLKLGGRILAFNVDKDFFDALDGFIVVDLKETDPKILAKYMGRKDAAEFRAFHGLDKEPEQA